MNKVTRLPTMSEEAAQAAEQMGYYLPPWKLSELVKTASKVLTVITNSKVQCTYAECRLILKIVESALEFTEPESGRNE